ncbi:hypothetical protein [Sphingomonas gilva]|uniref:hypothetical protein n=1 Tax=Sphingomonas gilva TaxID=2305907 RepID=UPI001CA4139B|nr:hypothetical protein [Sphingomonas gilva]
MKNVTVSLDDVTYRNARRRAAEADRSLSSVVRELLQSYGAEESEFDRLAREEDEIRADIKNFNGGERMIREELYDRDARRAEHEAALAKDRRRRAG